MPHADLKYSADLDLDPKAILQTIEAVIGEYDAGAGQCKGRAYPAEVFHHSHVLVEVSVLPKPHRDEAFMNALMSALEKAVEAHLSAPCAFSLAVSFSSETYVTNQFN